MKKILVILLYGCKFQSKLTKFIEHVFFLEAAFTTSTHSNRLNSPMTRRAAAGCQKLFSTRSLKAMWSQSRVPPSAICPKPVACNNINKSIILGIDTLNSMYFLIRIWTCVRCSLLTRRKYYSARSTHFCNYSFMK